MKTIVLGIVIQCSACRTAVWLSVRPPDAPPPHLCNDCSSRVLYYAEGGVLKCREPDGTVSTVAALADLPVNDAA